MTHTVFDHIIEYSFEGDKKIPRVVLQFNIASSKVFLDTKKT